MRLVRFLNQQSQVQYGKDLGGEMAEQLVGDPLACWPDAPKLTGQIVPIAKRLSPIEPVNIFCIGMNYKAHVAEMGGALPKRPVVFMKPTTAVQHPGQPVRIPKCEYDGPETDQEAELAVVIGKPARDVSVGDAMDYVFGYTCANDVSARWWQKKGSGGQFIRGKGFDTFCPLGPVLVTHGDSEDEISDSQALRVRGYLGDDCLQDGNTNDMIFSVAELVAFLSEDTMLVPGTVILTGTPPGVGWARDPKRLMQPGMESVIEIEGIGRLVNPVL